MESQEKQGENQEALLFFEDKIPGNVTPINFKQNQYKHKKSKPTVYENLMESIKLTNDESKVIENNPISDEVDSRGKNEKAPEYPPIEDMLSVIEDRNPQLTGQETQSPKYSINESFLKLQENPQSSTKNKLYNSCWNCGNTKHSLRECPEPKNYKQIEKNRKEFQSMKGSKPVYKRYHIEESERHADLVPGKISRSLRRALGLNSDEMPHYIYMMRLLGYPPGWLQEATVSHSGISMFDGQGNEVADPNTRQGEVMEQDNLDKYDIRKIVEYPGFNVPSSSRMRDDSKYWCCPPMSKRQSVEAMLEKLGSRVVGGYKRKKLANSTATSGFDDSTLSTEMEDMECEETPASAELPEDHCKFVPPLPEEDLPPPPPTELPDENSVENDTQSMLPTSIEENSLLELEEQKKLLLAELNDVVPLCGTPESRVGKVKSVDLGTPILKSVSPYARLPSAEKFSVNICDVINFENLPDSTGKYEKMSGLIRKVRCKLMKINNEA